jgi:phage shock protein PspC (stress-responsive transcriptional regulator)
MGWDVTLVRLALVVAVLLGCGAPVLAYVVAWIVIPEGPYFVIQPDVPAGAPAGSQTA